MAAVNSGSKTKTQSEIFEEDRKDAFLGQIEDDEEEDTVEDSDEDE